MAIDFPTSDKNDHASFYVQLTLRISVQKFTTGANITCRIMNWQAKLHLQQNTNSFSRYLFKKKNKNISVSFHTPYATTITSIDQQKKEDKNIFTVNTNQTSPKKNIY